MEGVIIMMQPVDIKSQSFGKGLFGYKKTDVDTYVDTVYRAYDELFSENKKLRDENDRLNKVIEENRLKLFNLENKAGSGSTEDAEKRSKQIIADAEKAAQDILARARQQSENVSRDSVKVETKASDFKVEPLKDGDEKAAPEAAPEKKEEKTQSAASRFFKQAEEASPAGDGDDDVFVGEIEDNRKPNKVMIGDGEEEGSDDFEFL